MKRFFPIFAFALGLLVSAFLLPVISGSASQLSQLGTVIGVNLHPVAPLGMPVYTFRTSPTKKTGFVPFALPEFPFYSDPQLETSIPFEGPLFVDVNGDSQVDMVYSRTISSSNSSGGQSNITAQKTQYVALNTGEGFAYTYRCRYYFSLYNSLQTETYSGDCAAD